jgi:hypothetical protein
MSGSTSHSDHSNQAPASWISREDAKAQSDRSAQALGLCDFARELERLQGDAVGLNVGGRVTRYSFYFSFADRDKLAGVQTLGQV